MDTRKRSIIIMVHICKLIRMFQVLQDFLMLKDENTLSSFLIVSKNNASTGINFIHS